MRHPRLLLTTTLLAIGLALPLQAQTTIEDLDQRVRGLETGMQAILEILQSQQGSADTTTAATSTTAEETPAPAPAGYQMGGLYLDVFTRAFTDDERDNFWYSPEKLPNGPQGVPAGSSLIKAPTSFAYAAFAKEAATSSFRQAKAVIGVQWSGILVVEKAGTHTFAVQIKKRQNNVGVTSCRSTLRINDKIVADALSNYRSNGSKEQIDNVQSAQELTAGIYDFSLWTNCNLRKEDGFDDVVTSVSLAAPGDRAPKPIPPERFGVQP